jgi:hypothetical protein
LCCIVVLQEVAADARDIVESAPSTLSSQLALEGTDLDADWAEAEAASSGRLTTTGAQGHEIPCGQAFCGSYFMPCLTQCAFGMCLLGC